MSRGNMPDFGVTLLPCLFYSDPKQPRLNCPCCFAHGFDPGMGVELGGALFAVSQEALLDDFRGAGLV